MDVYLLVEYHVILVIAVVGLVAGYFAGLFGIGGGAILVPIFYQIFGYFGVDEAVRMHVSVGSSLATIVPTSIVSFSKHYAKGAVDMDLLRSYLLPVPIGAICAAILTIYISGRNLRLIFALIALSVALKLLFAKSDWKLGNDIPPNPVRGIFGWLVGFLSTFMGIGGGVINNTFMILFGRNMHQAVATSSGVGVILSIPGTLGYIWAGWGLEGLPPWSLGFVNCLILLITIPMSALATPYGVEMAHRLDRRQIEKYFGVFLILVSARFFISVF